MITFERLLAVGAVASLVVPVAASASAFGDASGSALASSPIVKQQAGFQSTGLALRDPQGDYVGWVRFNDRSGQVSVAVWIRQGLTPGFHGLHIHANDNPDNGTGCNGDDEPPFSGVDGHYVGDGTIHGTHDGDLPMILVNNDGAAYMFTRASPNLEFSELAGKAVTVHSGLDNYANIPLGDAANEYTANSQAAIDATNAAGNAGSRVACGEIN